MRNAAILMMLLPPVVACGPSVPSVPDGETVSYAKHLEPLILKRCLSCHTAEKPEAELVLEEGTGYSRLVDRASVQIPTVRLVAPGDPDASYLWRKLEHDVDKGEGMPRTFIGAKKLPEPELALIRRWIAEGALP
jgi:hypothetical protein